MQATCRRKGKQGLTLSGNGGGLLLRGVLRGGRSSLSLLACCLEALQVAQRAQQAIQIGFRPQPVVCQLLHRTTLLRTAESGRQQQQRSVHGPDCKRVAQYINRIVYQAYQLEGVTRELASCVPLQRLTEPEV